MIATQTDTKANIGPSKKYCFLPFSKIEPELNHDQTIEVGDRELKVADRLKYVLSVWMDITSDENILDIVEHCHLEFTENPHQ